MTPSREPIAIIGIGCRFPGAEDVESFWRILREATETVGTYPGGRFDYIDRIYAEGKNIATSRGGFLPSPQKFDAAFFGISPREAALLDPQQRLLLEVAFEAVEDAGIPSEKIAGTRTGVFVGLWTSDYEDCVFEQVQDLDFYATTGGGRYPASGRLAYFLDLRGPNLTLDTACSSSLVAIHLACQSLRNGESEMALAGGANVILRPEVTLLYSAAKMLSPDGRSKFGDAAADGYVRSEGAGLLLLKPLSRALKDGDPVYAVIRGSAVNNDGRSSGLLISPSREGQEAMLRTALDDANVSPEAIDYIEAHGTGTLVGDPVEIQTIGRVVAGKRRSHPCVVGSVKTNIGHTESAAGAAGIIKVALSLERQLIPATLHFREPNPRIAWADIPVVVRNEPTPWPAGSSPRCAGVSGFGITGTNAHVVLQSVDQQPSKHEEEERPHLFLLSGHTPEALEALATSWQQRLIVDPRWPDSLVDLAYTAAMRRSHMDSRLALVASNRAELDQQLSAFVSKEEQSGVSSGRKSTTSRGRAVFVFPGQGGHWLGMGRGLYKDEPVFRAALQECDAAIRKHSGWSVVDHLMSVDGPNELESIDVVQPALFAIMVALAALWRSWGVEPSAVVGHSMGECAAAAVAGALSIEDAAAVICHRSRLMKEASGRGLMAIAEITMEDALKLTEEFEGRISVAANNSPTSTVLSGDADAIAAALQRLEAREVFCRQIKVDVASHSFHMDPFRERLAEALKAIHPRETSIPLYSTTSGKIEDGSGLTADYWSRNLRQPVLFSTGVQSLLKDGFDTFIEINAHPVLLQAIDAGIRHAEADALAIASLRREKPERAELLGAVGTLHVNGFPVDLGRLYPTGTCLRLPTRKWQGESHWIQSTGRAGRHGAGPHPKLGTGMESSVQLGVHLWEADLRPASTSIDTAAHWLEMAVSATEEATGNSSFDLHNIEFINTQVGSADVGQLAIMPTGTDAWSVTLSSRGSGGWTPRLRASVRLAREQKNTPDAAAWSVVELASDEASPIAASLRFAAESAGATHDASHIAAIARLSWYGPNAQTPSRVRIASELGAMQAHCRVERSDTTLAAEIEGVRFEATETQHAKDCMYELVWTPAHWPEARPQAQGLWVLVGPKSQGTDEIAAALTAAGDECVLVSDVESVEDILDSAGGSCLGVIRLASEDDPRRASEESFEIVRLVQKLNGARAAKPPRFWLVSTGAWHLHNDTGEVAVVSGTAWGLGRVIAREHPELSCSNVDLSRSPSSSEWQTLVKVLRHDSAEDQVAIRERDYFVARYERAKIDGTVGAPAFSSEATYLITGGLGGIGLKVARWLVQHGVRSLALAGRREPSAEARAEIAAITTEGIRVQVFGVDTADGAQLSSILESIRSSMFPLKGVFHAAAVVDDALLTETTHAQISNVMRSKALGAWNLHLQTATLRLEHFVLFSSIAAVVSQPGQGAYAGANGFLDALARHRRNLGLPATSIQWGVWANTGLANAAGTQRSSRDYVRRGIGLLSPTTALEAMGRILGGATASVLVSPFNWQTFVAAHGAGGMAPAFNVLAGNVTTTVEPGREDLRASLEAAEPGRSRRNLLMARLREQFAKVLKLDEARVDVQKPMGSMGLDSLMALEFVRRIAALTQVRIPATAVFNFSTLALFSEEVARRMGITLDKAGDVPQRITGATGISLAVAAGAERLTEQDAIRELIEGGEVQE